MKKLLSRFIFRLNGWKVIGSCDLPNKCLIVAAPHTSNWDFFIGMCYAYIVGIKPNYLVKSELFIPFLSYLLRWNGAIPVYRKSKNKMVEQVVDMFKKHRFFQLGISPEGTRSKVDRWKTGFYHIALLSKVPILLLSMDYNKKEIGIITQFRVTGSFNKDMAFIESQYQNIAPKIIDNYNPKIY